MLPSKLAFVDLETTGTSASFGRVIEIGILRVENGDIVQTYNSLVNPHTYLPPEITMLTGISGAQLETAPSFDEVLRTIQELLSDCIFVAHNVRFDYSFLKSEFARHGSSFTAKHFCTVRLSRMLFPEHRRHNLDSIIERFGFRCTNRHRAFDDAKILYDFYQTLQKTIAPEKLEEAVSTCMKRTSLPVKLKQTDVDALPESPGVYIFYGTPPVDSMANTPDAKKKRVKPKNLVPLYIGKSINIRDRVLSHFSADIRSGREMKIAQQIESIETIATAGELGALFLESRLIKKMLPIYNKMLRRKRDLIALKKKENKDGYLTAEIEIITPSFLQESEHERVQNPDSGVASLPRMTKGIDVNKLEDFIGFFRSKKQAKEYLHKMKDEHGLCEKLLGLEKTSSACFGYRLGKCHGACQKQEIALKYNIRFMEAFSKNKILPWPFSGPIFIEEENLLDGRTDCFVIDKWCYLGTIKSDKLGARDEELQKEYNFDFDTYKIVSRFMRNERNMKKIKSIPENQLTIPEEHYVNPSLKSEISSLRSS